LPAAGAVGADRAGGPVELVRSAPRIISMCRPRVALALPGRLPVILIHGQNTNPIAQRYFSVKNEASPAG